MSRVLLVLAAILVSGLALVSPASPAHPLPGAGDPLVLVPDGVGAPGKNAGYVEQQSPPVTLEHRSYCNVNAPTSPSDPAPDGCVYNFTGCPWTADSRVIFGSVGDVMPAGYTATAHQCLIADGFQHLNGINVQSPSPDLVVTIHFDPQNVTFTLPPHVSTWTKAFYENRDCIVGPFYGAWQQLGPIADSNGGVGLWTDITVTVTNPTGRRVRNVSAQYQLGSSEPSRQAQYCQGGDTGDFFGTPDGAIWQLGITSTAAIG